ncbi:single-stranded DNA-binding protein [Leucobacter sp. W1038]|uniref:single-stranded DNA-binding protein n=1 Tax=Leucobacter sp. W1038 TaxID=3438281 RepID=UPI003D99CD6B
MSNSVTVVGTIATEPRALTTQSGIALCSFRVASGERRFDREKKSWVDGETNWFTVTAFRGLALNAHDSFHKGDRVVVSGRLRIRSWERDDRSGTSVEIEAEALGHDLRWGVSQFSKKQRGEPESSSTEPESRWGRATGEQPGEEGAREVAARSPFAEDTEPADTSSTETSGNAENGFTSSGEPSSDGFVPIAA